ncbi:MAG: hypothetical protein HND48_21515 [Chloroflexi bacterium]|nr:hypothetical protein [Chloroflexota bacterium]
MRLAYIICDLFLVIPLGVAGGYGLKRGKSWGGPVFVLALGVLLFDIAHGMFYLIWDNYFGIPLWLGFILLAVLIVYTAFAIRALMQSSPPA